MNNHSPYFFGGSGYSAAPYRSYQGSLRGTPAATTTDTVSANEQWTGLLAALDFTLNSMLDTPFEIHRQEPVLRPWPSVQPRRRFKDAEAVPEDTQCSICLVNLRAGANTSVPEDTECTKDSESPKDTEAGTAEAGTTEAGEPEGDSGPPSPDQGCSSPDEQPTEDAPQDPRPALVTDCGHYFCRPCLEEWLKHKRTCPNCRQRI